MILVPSSFCPVLVCMHTLEEGTDNCSVNMQHKVLFQENLRFWRLCYGKKRQESMYNKAETLQIRDIWRRNDWKNTDDKECVKGTNTITREACVPGNRPCWSQAGFPYAQNPWAAFVLQNSSIEAVCWTFVPITTAIHFSKFYEFGTVMRNIYSFIKILGEAQ